MQEIRTAYTLEELQEVQDILQAEDIYCQVYQNISGYETIYNSNPIGVSYKISVEENDAQRAFEILAQHYGNIDENNENFLSQMDTDDLVEMLAHPQKYNANDCRTAQKLILERGISSNELESKIAQMVQNENTPKQVNTFVLLAGYAFAFFGGIFGMAIGWYLYFSKNRHTQTRQKYFAHDQYSRNHGLIILVIGIIALVLLYFFQVSLIDIGTYI